MKPVIRLNYNDNLWGLMEAKRHLDKASALFDRIFEEDGAPCDEKGVDEAFFGHITGAEKCLERLVGTVVYKNIFETEFSPTREE